MKKRSLVLLTVCGAALAALLGALVRPGVTGGRADTRRVGPAAPVPAPRGERVHVPVTRDTWFSNVGNEADCNLGGAARLKLKSNQEMSLIDIDAAPLRGRVIRGATLHLKLAGDQPLRRVTVSSFGADWVEGTSASYKPQEGSSTFNRRRHPDVPWTVPGSDLCSVILGEGGTLWRMADAFLPDAGGWQRVAVDPAVVAARSAGISYGFLLFDDTGSEWTRAGDKFTPSLFPNRLVHSRESGPASAPYLTVFLGPEDKAPPATPGGLRSEVGDLPAGEAWVSWTTPADEGPAGTIGFVVSVDGKELSRYLVPVAGKPGARVRMHLRDLGLRPGAEVQLAVRAVDGAGNVGPAAEAAVRVSDKTAPALPTEGIEPFQDGGDLPRLGEAEIAVVDELDKLQPVNGRMIPPQPAGYLAANHLWNARAREVRLQAARNEFVGFQVVIRGTASGIQPTLTFAQTEGSRLQVAFGRYRNVATRLGPLPDPIVPLDGPFDLPEEGVRAQKSGSLYCEVYVPHEAAAGEHRGKLTVKAGDESIALQVSLRVWDFTLPDYLSFVPEMNSYGLPGNERAYYRLAHRHRTVLNRVPYSQSGNVYEGCAPSWDGAKLDWKAWDRRFGPYFDGSAFADLPRRGVPLECFYLPLHENWPTPIEGNYNGDYWADQAFPPSYRDAFVEVSRQFAAHFNAQDWNDTLFQFFLNGKSDFKRNGWSRASSPWILDEPANFQDFWALRYFGTAFHEGANKAPGHAKMVFRCDVSRPQWQRNTLDGLLDYNVVSGALRPYHRLVFDRKAANGELVIEYGGSNALEDSNLQPVAWSLDAWALGCDGVLPWQTIGTADSWKRADPLALFYPGASDKDEPVPSIRLKAYRRGQQDVEYLTLLAALKGEPRWALGRQVREALHLEAERRGTGFVGGEDAGMLHYDRLRPQDVWAVRTRLGKALSDARPVPKRKLVDLRTPRRDLARLVPGYVSVGEVPGVAGNVAAGAPSTGATKFLQGRGAVRDALIDPDQATRALGRVARDNPIKKGKECNAFLVRFDLGRLDLPKGARVEKATVSFYVWDPSSRGNTKVCAFALKTPWDETAATWQQPARGKAWQGGDAFAFGRDTGPAGPSVVVKPDQGSDTVDPPLEYQLDVTDLVRAWVKGSAPNHGLAIAPVSDRSIDEGFFTRFQIYGSEYERVQYTPKLAVQVQAP